MSKVSSHFFLFLYIALSLLAGNTLLAQTPPPVIPADCLIKTLGKPANDTAVILTFQELGLTPPNQAEGTNNTRQGVRVSVNVNGIIESIMFFNDSIRFSDRAYRRYRGPLPFGFTFADSLGIEENTLFAQEAANHISNETSFDGIPRYLVGVKAESGEQAYRMDIYFTPARDYFMLKNAGTRLQNLRRTYWYRFRLEKYPLRGNYLEMPLLCDGKPDSFTPRERYSRGDSLYSLNFELNALPLGRGFLKEDLEAGFGFGIILRTPLSKRYSPPVQQQFGFSYASHTYKAFSGETNPAGMSVSSLFYGLYVQPKKGFFPTNSGLFHPYVDVRLYGDLIGNSKLTNAKGEDLKPGNVSWGSQGGAGIMYEAHLIQGGVGVNYRYSRKAEYLHLFEENGAVFDAIETKSAYHAVAIQFWIGIKFIGN